MNSTINPLELEKFKAHAETWWDANGPLKTLHDINPARLMFIQSYCSLSRLQILDIGCGGGLLSEAMAIEGAQVVGLDAEETVIAAAKLHAKTSQVNLEYVCSPIENYEALPFDVITCMEMLEHVDNFELIIQHAARLLKPGGILFLSTINRTLWAYLQAIVAAEYILSILPRQTHEYRQFIRPSELARVLRQYGFDLVALKGLGYNPFTRAACLTEEVDVNYLLAARLKQPQ